MRRLSLLALFLPVVALGATPCIETCKTLLAEGNVLLSQGKNGQAYDKYKAAMAATPDAPLPLLSASTLLLDLSWHATGTQAGKLHDEAEALARQALHLAPADPLAQDVLRQVLDGPPVVLHAPTPSAEQAMGRAETLYVQGRFDDARKEYEAAAALDPAWSAPWVGAGDCYFGQQDWPHAEALFRRATAIEPRNGQAWRFLSDSLIKQGKTGAGEDALYGAITANPADRNSWAKLAAARAHAQRPLTSLHLSRGGSPAATAYQADLAAWRTALQHDDAAVKSAPALLQMQTLANDGQLDAALLILAYRPPYRPAFDAWLAAHPDGVKAFIDRYALQP